MSNEIANSPQDVAEQEGFRWAVTENGQRLQFSEREVEIVLKALALNGGRHVPTSEFVNEQGIAISQTSVKAWRDKQFPRLYLRLRRELSRDIGEDIAGKAMERALQADAAEQLYIEAASNKVDQVEPNHLAKNALALANAKSQNIEKAQLLRHEPTEIVETRDIGDLVGVLERLGVVEKPKQVAIEHEA